MRLSNYLTKNYSLRKVEIDSESPSTPIHSTLTGERPHTDSVTTTSTETGSYQRVPVLFILDIIWLSFNRQVHCDSTGMYEKEIDKQLILNELVFKMDVF